MKWQFVNWKGHPDIEGRPRAAHKRLKARSDRREARAVVAEEVASALAVIPALEMPSRPSTPREYDVLVIRLAPPAVRYIRVKRQEEV